jgi:succinate dehydrogenase / fumarate reductase cytochrome b subunit
MVTTISQKSLMALTGLFLCTFLVVHLLGNLQLFLPDGQAQQRFNWYAETLSSLLVIEIAAVGTYVCIVAHAVISVVLTIRNRRSAGKRYRASGADSGSAWYSRFMGILGFIILAFLIVHMSDFWFPFKTHADIGLDSEGRRDLHGLVVREFQRIWKVGLYELGVLAVGFHVAHGFYSGCRSLGIHHPRLANLIRWFGFALAFATTVGFGAMPIYILWTH